jgi:hypothetical protein
MRTSLIDTYVSEVGRRLTSRNRSDIEAELHSTLQDMLDERSQKSGRAVDENMILEVLREYGSPVKVAATYTGERSLIGPQFFPSFVVILRIVLVVLGVLALAGLIISLSHTTLTFQAIGLAILKAIGSFIASGLTAFGNVVLVFALIEWAVVYSGTPVKVVNLSLAKEWDPRSLLKAPASSRISMGNVIGDLVGAFAAIVIFNFYPQVLGFGYGPGGLWYIGAGSGTYTPLLSKGFFQFVPFLTVIWVLTMLLDLVLLRMGQWSAPTRIGQIVIRVLNIIITAGLLSVPSLLGLTPAFLTVVLGNAATASSLLNTLNIVLRVLLWLSIFGSGVEIVRSLYRLMAHDLGHA